VEQAVAYSALAATVSLAVTRPRFSPRIAVTPGMAGLFGVLVLVTVHLLTPSMLLAAARVQWRPLLTLTSIMIITGVVQDVGAFDRLAARIEQGAKGRTAVSTFNLVFVLSYLTPAVLNNDAAILILTPLVVTLSRRLYPESPATTFAFAFAVFLAPGVAPLFVSNPMNMIVAQYAGLDFNSYAAAMVPVSLAGAAMTYVVLRVVFRRALAVRAVALPPVTQRARAGERAAVLVMLAVLLAYPVAASLHLEIWTVAVAGALASLAVYRAYDVGPLRKATSHVSPDILVFLWAMLAVVQALRGVGIVAHLHTAYAATPDGSPLQLGTIGVTSAFGSAVIDNHPMALLDMLALDTSHGSRPLLAALVGADVGPRLLPIGSLAGLLWIDLLRRRNVHVGVTRFLRIGTAALIPTLLVCLLVLQLLR
jgi:arsenical pump membrane protein